MKFTKMQSYGNDYVYIQLLDTVMHSPSEWAKFVSKPHYGIGSDGMILLEKSDISDFRMRVFNPDGSEAEMCGNALRSAAMLYYESGHTNGEYLTVETLSGIKNIFLHIKDGHVDNITAEIGKPAIISRGLLKADKYEFEYAYINIGNPHCVVFCDDPENIEINSVGKSIEHSPLFPVKANVEFCSVRSRNELFIRTWERSCGETLCCATGSACALIASVFTGRADKKATVHNRGGDIIVEWKDDEKIYITGKSKIVFSGDIEMPRSEEK